MIIITLVTSVKFTMFSCRLIFLTYFVVCFVYQTEAFPEQKPLNNNPTFRGISDRLDRALGWGGYDDPRQSKIRGALHGAYHEFQYRRTGNPREHERAKDQWGVVTGGRRDNLQRYDATHKRK